MDDSTAKKVGELLARRTEFQAAKEYDEADSVHAELTEMNISLDSRLKTWRLGRQETRGRRYDRNRW